MVEYATVIYV